jgi:ArsR family transcriptional regulator
MESHLIFKMLGDETRLRIIMIIKERQICVCELEQILDMKQARISKQLMSLRENGLVISKRVGLRVFYELSEEFVSSKGLMTYLDEIVDGCNQLVVDKINLNKFDETVDTKDFVCQTMRSE